MLFKKIFKKNVSNIVTLNPVKNKNCTEFEVDNWVLSEFVLNKLIPIVGYHPYPLDELMLMAASVCRITPTHIFEWGTHIGKSARIFYETSIYFNIKCQVHSFDLPDETEHIEHPHNQRGCLVKKIDAIKLYQEDGLRKGIEIFKNSTISNKKALFYLDGDHSYNTVINELKVLFKMLPNASILLHDTFYQSSLSGYNIGPYQAITDILKNLDGKYITLSTKLGLPGMTLLYKK